VALIDPDHLIEIEVDAGELKSGYLRLGSSKALRVTLRGQSS
jgi:hypothetical protein